ncbi:hypothetical protein BaRGS_00018945, partial [Batillaria attramentaria]
IVRLHLPGLQDPRYFAFNLTYSLSLGQVRHCKLRVWQGRSPGQDVRVWDQHLVPDELKAKLTVQLDAPQCGNSSDSGECLDPEAWPRQQVSVQYGRSRAVFDLRSAPSGLVPVCSRLTSQGWAVPKIFWTCDGLPCDKKHSQQDGQLVVRGLTVNNTMSVLVHVRLKHNLDLVGNSSKVIQGQAEGGLPTAIRCYVNCDGGSVHEVTVLAAECTNCPQDTSLTYRWTYTATNSPSFKEPLTSFADEKEVTQKRLKLRAGWMENVPA